MSDRTLLRTIGSLLIALLPLGCGSRQACLSVSGVRQDAASLEGKRVCVRGRPYFLFDSNISPMCPPGDSKDVSGTLILYEENEPPKTWYRAPRLSISKDSLRCAGNECGMTCEPFDPQSNWGFSPGRTETVEVFEIVGILRVKTGDQQTDSTLVLEEVDLESSRQVVGGEPQPIPTGVFRYVFP